MENRYNYTLDKRGRHITTTITVIVLLIAGFLLYRFMNTGTYIPAWFLSIAFAIGALYVLSIPRFIRVTDSSVEIHCLVELTKLHLDDIKSIKRIDNAAMKHSVPLLGSYGFWGYYGYYFNLTEWEMLKVYASKWNDFVEIEDIYEQKFIVNCDQADDFVADVLARKNS